MIDHRSPWMTAEIELVGRTAARFFAEEMVPHRARWERQGLVERSLWNKAGAMGLLCASIPEEYGGGGGNFAHEAAIAHEQIFADMIGWANSVHSGIVAHYLLAYGSEEQRMNWLPKMATGELVGAIAMTEPGTGSDLKAVRTAARLVGDRYVLNGQKTFISNGQNADLIIVVAKTDPSKGSRGTSLIVVETRDLHGFRRGRNLEKIGQHMGDTSELFFEDVEVPAANLLGLEEGLGFGQLMQQLPVERLFIALTAVSGMERALQVTTDYAKQRSAFGKQLVDFQNTRFKLADCKTTAAVARVYVDDCLLKLLDGNLDAPTASMAKLWATERHSEVVDACLQLHGGYGYMAEYPIARMFVDNRIQRIYGGSNEIMKELIGRTL